ncbi:hypothetical protein OGM63_18195 [Plectonema radiosum NIES-515]|uniref:Uncharacterized protein n=1 Tax=Plectonema radiosum NIES-515 TaxID=2986073 RepID=A0ABT3B218_9CYAN|nr:hypothetical protein [Plectonema radiosum]MCV3215422.1 hypothetical protein [Plectonema radiosum NIES-515]
MSNSFSINREHTQMGRIGDRQTNYRGKKPIVTVGGAECGIEQSDEKDAFLWLK